MYGWGGTSNNVNAQVEADRLARLATQSHPEDEDPAGERAERMVKAVRAVVGSIIVVAIAIGAAWVFFGPTPALVATGVAGLVAVAVVMRYRIGRRIRTEG